MVQPEQVDSMTVQQQTWAVYATNPAGLLAGDDSEQLENAPARIGQPLPTYTPGD